MESCTFEPKRYPMTARLSVFSMRDLWAGFVHLLYPSLCVACGKDVPAGDSCFCIPCRLKLEPTGMQLQGDNDFTLKFWGRVPLQGGAAMYYFTRKSAIQHAVHQLKYRNAATIGLKLGREFARERAGDAHASSIDLIIPVPLHPRKLQQRGYNQSTMFAQGISEIWGIPVLENILCRQVHAASQTRKKRLERFQNVGEAFYIRREQALYDKHVLLVDDVLTTGATLETCALKLLHNGRTRVSMATIAMAMNR